ncbi:hypothetical protein OKA04_06995 [Luteolibacter flavescens]|uniref:Uncharacterized protein n=1 Tax=Luteolibacter flavescens TaxID=1859460 RepID=A0ABT3FLL0_9BACT|nr:hypothetical protein [Luteolibacter flavescens]MCW1884472.1 hypothetical protein [Luteolibacter flavescens]
MKSLAFVLPLLILGMASCDKAKRAVHAAREKIEGSKDPELPSQPGGEVGSEFAGQVDSGAEGVRFRRDLAFPTSVEARVTDRATFHRTRKISNSALGTETLVLEGTFEIVGMFRREGSRLTLAIEKAGKVVDPKEAMEKAKAKATTGPPPPPGPVSLAGAKVEFQQTRQGWQLAPRKGPMDFNLKVLEQNLLPNLPGILVQHGLMPRRQWFSSSRRWSAGDTLVLEGDSLALLFDSGASGRITLTFEATEAMEGHPCGRFAVEGDVSIKNDTTLDGNASSGELTIQSGKVWCSLVHPLVLREEYKTVRTVTQGQGSGPKQKLQGEIDEMKSRQWKSLSE